MYPKVFPTQVIQRTYTRQSTAILFILVGNLKQSGYLSVGEWIGPCISVSSRHCLQTGPWKGVILGKVVPWEWGKFSVGAAIISLQQFIFPVTGKWVHWLWRRDLGRTLSYLLHSILKTWPKRNHFSPGPLLPPCLNPSSYLTWLIAIAFLSGLSAYILAPLLFLLPTVPWNIFFKICKHMPSFSPKVINSFPLYLDPCWSGFYLFLWPHLLHLFLLFFHSSFLLSLKHPKNTYLSCFYM